MKLSISALLLASLTALTSAASINDIPQCARPCLEDAIKSKTSCAVTDSNCVCSGDNFSKVQGAATGCVLDACGSDTALNQVLPAAQKICG
ncbi:CFEM domain-containing protein [Aspergillus mulundensis]|uniref:CFEM domain-containing protein n=1 Tax=Aspergillus mulundensis TaxID=1810919 RepID=A0A3D8SL68_9EURO|nr:Uncharacterized protein DSM5745_03695 [Aspergillus mulundensis]RDW87053.1 Uncharacterized protein DSM5745_03695 [Aspergillus mulundensis]